MISCANGILSRFYWGRRIADRSLKYCSIQKRAYLDQDEERAQGIVDQETWLRKANN